LYTEENIDLNNLIFDYYSLDEINNAFNTIEKSKDFFGRGVILFDWQNFSYWWFLYR